MAAISFDAYLNHLLSGAFPLLSMYASIAFRLLSLRRSLQETKWVVALLKHLTKLGSVLPCNCQSSCIRWTYRLQCFCYCFLSLCEIILARSGLCAPKAVSFLYSRWRHQCDDDVITYRFNCIVIVFVMCS